MYGSVMPCTYSSSKEVIPSFHARLRYVKNAQSETDAVPAVSRRVRVFASSERIHVSDEITSRNIIDAKSIISSTIRSFSSRHN